MWKKSKHVWSIWYTCQMYTSALPKTQLKFIETDLSIHFAEYSTLLFNFIEVFFALGINPYFVENGKSFQVIQMIRNAKEQIPNNLHLFHFTG